jgi:hypothetical protein
MGTNYYARIIPKEEDIKKLHELINLNDFKAIREKTYELYERFEPYSADAEPTGYIHLGKRSGGWKFLWNPNLYTIRNGHYSEIEPNHFIYVIDPDTAYYLYPLTKEGIKSFIDREDIEIFNEYNEKEDKEEFFKMALNWDKESWDSDSYHLAFPDEKVWNCKNEYTDFLESLGYKLSKDKSDFYSDDLRFATSTDFC